MTKIERDVRPNQTEFDYPTMSEQELRELAGHQPSKCVSIDVFNGFRARKLDAFPV